MTITLKWDAEQLEMPDLEPPYTLTSGYQACQQIKELQARGVIQGSTRADIRRWVTQAMGYKFIREREAIVDDAVSFLNGAKMSEADAIFKAGYTRFLQEDAMAIACIFIANVIVDEFPDAVWEQVSPVLVDCLPGF